MSNLAVKRLRRGTELITADIVAAWFAKYRPPWPSRTQCELVAAQIRTLQAGDHGLTLPDAEEISTTEWWDFKSCSDAVRTLQAAVPTMQAFLEDIVFPVDEQTEALRAIISLRSALADATNFIDRPFGPYEPAKGLKKAKPWHTASRIIGPVILEASRDAGHDAQGFAGSVAGKVVCDALKALGFPDQEESTVARYLDRWFQRYGWPGSFTAAPG